MLNLLDYIDPPHLSYGGLSGETDVSYAFERVHNEMAEAEKRNVSVYVPPGQYRCDTPVVFDGAAPKFIGNWSLYNQDDFEVGSIIKVVDKDITPFTFRGKDCTGGGFQGFAVHQVHPKPTTGTLWEPVDYQPVFDCDTAPEIFFSHLFAGGTNKLIRSLRSGRMGVNMIRGTTFRYCVHIDGAVGACDIDNIRLFMQYSFKRPFTDWTQSESNIVESGRHDSGWVGKIFGLGYHALIRTFDGVLPDQDGVKYSGGTSQLGLGPLQGDNTKFVLLLEGDSFSGSCESIKHNSAVFQTGGTAIPGGRAIKWTGGNKSGRRGAVESLTLSVGSISTNRHDTEIIEVKEAYHKLNVGSAQIVWANQSLTEGVGCVDAPEGVVEFAIEPTPIAPPGLKHLPLFSVGKAGRVGLSRRVDSGSVNKLDPRDGAKGKPVVLGVDGEKNADIAVVPNGTGKQMYGTRVPRSDNPPVTGHVVWKDADGVPYKVATVD